MNSKSGSVTWAMGIAVVALAVSVSTMVVQRRGGAASGDSLTKIQNSKVMNVCVAEWPPFSIKDAKTGKYSGVDIDAMEAIAKSLDAKVTYHDTTFGNMPAAIQSGTCDVGTSLYVTPNRSAAVDFTRPVLFGGDTALVKKGETRFKTIADLDKTGIKVATATGESGDIYAKANFTKASVVPIDVDSSDQTRFLLEVTSGRADVGIADYNTIANFAAAHPETMVIFQDNPFNLSADAYGVRYGDTSFLDFLNNSLQTMQVNGSWDQLEKKYNAQAFHQQLNIK